MNDISMGRSPSTVSRISRGVGAAALSAVLIVGLAGCMTGKLASSEPVQKNAVAPAGVDPAVPADRIEQQLARQAAANRANTERFAGRTADRVAEELARQTGSTTTVVAAHEVHQGSWTDRVTAQAEFEAREGAEINPYPGMTADHIDRLLVQAR
jgi:hypothetical protein